MKDEQREFYTTYNAPPMRLNVEQAAWALNCQVHDIPVLVAAKLLKPLGNPRPNAVKYFSTHALHELHRDVNWQAKATNALYERWRDKNRQRGDGGPELGLAA